jgi:hypothetical protein
MKKLNLKYPAFAAFVFVFLLSLNIGAAHAGPPVIELFTSQGCSSCPPADAYLAELAQRDDVIALTLPVDYWDYLGWQDTLATPSNTSRQRAYASTMGLKSVFTPQMIINGRVQHVGSRRMDVDKSIQDQMAHPLLATLELKVSGDEMEISISGDVIAADATVWLSQIDTTHQVPIRKGENGGKTIEYRNVVRDMSPIGMWRGGDAKFTIPLNEVRSAGRDGCVIIVQQKGTGVIMAAAMMDMN